MFGYIKPDACSLSEEEQALYKATYCGLCHSLGNISGPAARFTLSYDLAFLALLRMGVMGETIHTKQKRCPTHPFNGCCAVIDSPNLNYCAALSVLLTHECIKDSLLDEKGIRHLFARIGELPTRSFLNKACAQYDLPHDIVKDHLNKLHEMEIRGCKTPDEGAEIFGNMLAEISAYGIEDEMLRFSVSKIMFGIGKWIYLVDAADDFQSDLKNNRFNPFIPNGIDSALLANSLDIELSVCENILSKTPNIEPKIRNILRSILYNGTYSVSQSILFKQNKNERTRKRHYE